MVRDPRILAIGGSSVVSAYDNKTVLKGYVAWLDGKRRAYRDDPDECKASLEREHEVYTRLGQHPNILKYFGQVEVEPDVFSLRLELALYRDLRSFIQDNEPVSIARRQMWVVGLASALSHLHVKGVFQCDFTCRNAFLTGLDTVKLGDFGGASIDGKDPNTAEEPWYELPLRGRSWDERPYDKREIFALGCAIYEIMAWSKPFASLNESEVTSKYAHEEFPDLTGICDAIVIRKCWQEAFNSVEDVLVALDPTRISL